MKHSVFLSVDSYESELKEATAPIESLIIFSVYKYCQPSSIDLFLVHNGTGNSTASLKISFTDDSITFTPLTEVPWQVASCVFPVVQYADTIITGLCGVARHICKFRTSPQDETEHAEGLLGFKRTCLQAPNETSVWTKFCEVDIIKTVKSLLCDRVDSKFSEHILRFEGHMSNPVKIHNILKVTQNKQNGSKVKTTAHIDSMSNLCLDNLNITGNDGREEMTNKRNCKSRKWGSSKTDITSTKPEDDFKLEHSFAEGPFFTLADLLLFPCFAILRYVYGEKFMTLKLPLIFKWLNNIEKIKSLEQVIHFLQRTLIANKNINNLIEIDGLQVSNVNYFSLYKSDKKRHNPKSRMFTKEKDIEEALAEIKDLREFIVNSNLENINWLEIPDGANPNSGHLPEKRMSRKTQQLENLALAVVAIAKENDIIVDFCSGSGHLGILIAYLLPHCKIILLENKEQSLLRARARVNEMKLINVYFFQCNLDFFIGKFDIGVALHACGIATDLVMDKCLKSNAKFVICPCCYGSLHTTDRLSYPRSKAFSYLDEDKYICIGHAADQTHTDHHMEERGVKCMAIIDTDRAKLAEENGYSVKLNRLNPLTCTPKNNLLIGLPNKKIF